MKLFIRIFIFIITLPMATLFAQEQVKVSVKILDKTTRQAIENVHIKVHHQNIISRTNNKGEFEIRFQHQQFTTLVISHTSYNTHYEVITNNTDSIYLNITLEQKVVTLNPVEITSSNEPIPVFKSVEINILDYEFHQDKFVFIAYEKNPDKDSKLYLVDKNEEILASHFIPCTPKELYTDYLGNINLICNDAIYRIEIIGYNFTLYKLPLEDFYQMIKPIVDSTGNSLIFSDFMRDFPKFKYYAYNTQDTSISVIKEVVHHDMEWQYLYEYHDLNNAQRQFAKRMAKRYKNYDKHDIAAMMTGFSRNFLYDPVYAPLFVSNDTLLIFDHYDNFIWKYTQDTLLTDSINIDYHQEKSNGKWKKQLLMDELNGTVYALFIKQGYYLLKHINTNTGKVADTFQLQHQFVSKIKIKDGFVYYTYKPQQTLQKKFLFKEKL